MASRRLDDRLVGWLAALAGCRPAVVAALGRAMDRAAVGHAALLREKNPRGGRLTPEAVRILMLVVTALGSVILALVMLVNPSDMHPRPGVIVVAAAHWFLVLMMVIGRAGPSLLVEDDLKVIGSWPVARREILLARLTTLLRPALEITLALVIVPLVIYSFTGPLPVVSSLTLLVGLLIQTAGLTGGVAAVLMLCVRWLGRRRAERLAALLADGNAMLLVWLLMLASDQITAFFKAHPQVLLYLPPVWGAGWGDHLSGPGHWAAAAAGALISLTVFAAGLRSLTPESAPEVRTTESPRVALRWDLGGILARALAPMMPGREGRVLRVLLAAHLREDWRFVAGMASIPLVLALMFFIVPDAIGDDPVFETGRASALAAVPNMHLLFIMAMQLVLVASYSSRPLGLWIVALADLDGSRLLRAQRGMIRGLITLPVLVLFAVKAADLGTPWPVVLRDAAVLALEMEIVVVLLQARRRTMPFSLAYTRDHDMRRILYVILMMFLVTALALWNYAYAEWAPARLVTWVALPALAVLVTVLVDRRLAGVRLDMSAAAG